VRGGAKRFLFRVEYYRCLIIYFSFDSILHYYFSV
jgi:hypothetical protein